ncbi:hypothetical protein [uncultured Algimonas sp.]|uniref:hypothetical protein n=1 Tax=uncultured Algimonas sp. TaxID=1547920 RepID=UPI0026130E93|nr:hypothetical protein [uncultured Algimonas sp.]
MITREYILYIVIALQTAGLFGAASFTIAWLTGGGRPWGLMAELGGIVLVIWVSVSHLMLLRRYKILRAERIS